MTEQLSQSMEDYLEAILRISADKKVVRVRDLAGAVVHLRHRGLRERGRRWCYSSMPRRRAERARWREARMRRSRFTSIGSASRAAGLSSSVLSTW